MSVHGRADRVSFAAVTERAEPKATNLTWHAGDVPREARERLLDQRGTVLWLTGLSGSGKSTVSRRVEARLVAKGKLAYVLDGDNVRHGLCADLGFSPEDREENIRRVGEVARLFVDAGVIVLAAFVSPYRRDRDRVRALVGEGGFVEIHVTAPLEVCEARDPKGLYAKARAGEVRELTGVSASAPYEEPTAPEIRLDTHALTIEECTDLVIDWLERGGYLAR